MPGSVPERTASMPEEVCHSDNAEAKIIRQFSGTVRDVVHDRIRKNAQLWFLEREIAVHKQT